MISHGPLPLTYAFNNTAAPLMALPAKVKDAKEVYNELNSKVALLGIFDTRTNTMYLHPVIPHYVWIEIDRKTGEYTDGWTVDRNLQKGDQLSREELEMHHSSGHAPRIFSYKGEENDYRSHHFLLQAIGQTENISSFRGFSISEKGELVWISRALNGPHGHDLVQDPHKSEIEDQIKEWRHAGLRVAG